MSSIAPPHAYRTCPLLPRDTMARFAVLLLIVFAFDFARSSGKYEGLFRLLFFRPSKNPTHSHIPWTDLVELTCETDQDCEPFRSATVNSTCIEEHCRCTDLSQNGNATECRPLVSSVTLLLVSLSFIPNQTPADA